MPSEFRRDAQRREWLAMAAQEIDGASDEDRASAAELYDDISGVVKEEVAKAVGKAPVVSQDAPVSVGSPSGPWKALAARGGAWKVLALLAAAAGAIGSVVKTIADLLPLLGH